MSMSFIGFFVGLWTSLPIFVEGASSTKWKPIPQKEVLVDMNQLQNPSVAVSGFMAPTQLLNLKGSRRPGWGRDYGPDMGLPKHVAADPFGNGAVTTPPPQNQPLADQVEPTSVPTAAPEFNQSHVPDPPKKAPELSPSDQKEKVKHQATELAGAIQPMAGMPESFSGSSCKEICATCEIARAQLKDPCTCWADCQIGAIGGKCGAARNGWSDNHDTKPFGEWTGFCSTTNQGDFACSDCLSSDFKYELGNCTTADEGEAMCLHKLREELTMGLAGKSFCTNKDLPSCQEFPEVPKEDDESDLKWFCFDTRKTCIQEKYLMTHGDDRVYDYKTKSVWKPIFEEAFGP